MDPTVAPPNERKRKNRAAAETSRQAKVEALGRKEYLRIKAEAAATLRQRRRLETQAAAAAAAAAAPTAPTAEAAPVEAAAPTAAANPVAAAPQPRSPPDIPGQLIELAQLRSQGVLDDAEFAIAKARVLGAPPPAAPPPTIGPRPSAGPDDDDDDSAGDDGVPPAPQPAEPPPAPAEPPLPAAAASPARPRAAPSAAPSPRQATIGSLAGVSAAAEQLALSDSLDVSSALYLGATDMLKLKAVLESSDDRDHGARALRRLAMVPMTAKLARTTGIAAYMAKLQFELEQSELDVPGVCEELRSTIESVARIRRTWDTQISEERAAEDRRLAREAAAKAPKPPRPKDPECLACQGRHRAHTCGAPR